MSTGRADRWLQSHCTYWSADGQMKLIFWGRQCRHISSSRCKAILSRGSGANLVHLDRLWSPASANCTLSDGSTHPSCFPTCLTTMVLTLSLIWYTHSVMDSRQHALWQIERSVCTVLSAGYFAQLGMHHPYKAGLFNMLATVRGPCGQDPSTCLINVASPTMPVQSSSPLTNNYSITDLNRMSQTLTVCMACTLGENVRLMRKGTPQRPLLRCCTFIFLWVVSAIGYQLKNQWNDVQRKVSPQCNRMGCLS